MKRGALRSKLATFKSVPEGLANEFDKHYGQALVSPDKARSFYKKLSRNYQKILNSDASHVVKSEAYDRVQQVYRLAQKAPPRIKWQIPAAIGVLLLLSLTFFLPTSFIGLFSAAPVENQAPMFVADTNVIDVDGTITIDLDTWFTDPEGDKITYIANAPIGILLAIDGSQLQIAPEPGFEQDTMTVIASDGTAITKQEVLIRNAPTPTAAIITPTPVEPPAAAAEPTSPVRVLERDGTSVLGSVEFIPQEDEQFGIGISTPPTTSDILLTLDNHVVETIQMFDVDVSAGIASTQYIEVDDVPEEAVPEIDAGHGWSEVYALNPHASFAKAHVTVTAKGNRVYKCKDWDFASRTCLGTWELHLRVQPGQDYGIVMTANDPAYGEINVTDADHLDETYIWLSDIFLEVEHEDGLWSEEIPENNYVRAVFGEFLTNGNVINVRARPSGTTPSYFIVYEMNTTHEVGRSPLFTDNQRIDIALHNISGSLDSFDFKIVDDAPASGGLEFDYIHDALGQEGWVMYASATAPLTASQPVMMNVTGGALTRPYALYAPDLGAEVSMQKMRCSKERAECYLMSALADRSLHFSVWTNATRSWAMTTLDADTGLNGSQFFDVECEDVSGDCLIVYESDTVADSSFLHRNYTSGGLSSAGTVTTGLETTNGQFKFIRLYPKYNNDSIGIGLQNSAGSPEISAGLWNGSTFHSFRSFTINGAQLSRRSFDCAWDLSGRFNCFFGNTTDGVFAYENGGGWTQRGLVWNIVAQGWEIDVCGSDPLTGGLTHDLVGLIACDQDADTNVNIWNTTAKALKGTSPGEEIASECGANKINGLSTRQHQCAWESSDDQAVFVYVDNGAATPESGTYTMSTNSWNIADLTTGTSVGNAWGNDPNTLLLMPHPDSDNMFLTGNDIVADTECTKWTGSAWSATGCGLIDTNGTTLNTSFSTFDYFRYEDPAVVPDPCTGTIVASTTLSNDQTGTGSCITFGADNIYLDCNGHSLTYDTSGDGNVSAITADGRKNVNVTNCVILDGNSAGTFGIAINYTNTNSSFISGNSITTDGTFAPIGILFRDSVNNTILGNTIITNGRSSEPIGDNTTRAMGIWLTEGSNYNRLINNSVTTDGSNHSMGIVLGSAITGVSGPDSASNNSVEYNLVRSGGTNERNYGIHLNYSAQQNNISHNRIFTRGNLQNQGIRLENSTDNLILNNTINTNGTSTFNDGILLATNADRNTLIENDIVTNGTSDNYGIRLLTNVNYSAVLNNTIFTNGSLGTNYGIIFSSVSWNNATDNRILTFGNMTNHGVLLTASSYNVISNNSIKTHSRVNNVASTNNQGMELSSTSPNNIITGNHVTTNGTGFNYGIEIASGGNNTIHNNTVFTGGNGSSSYGIYASGATARYSNISSNIVNTTSNSSAYGIYLGAGNNYRVWNNTISTFGKNGSSASPGIVFVSHNSTVYANNIQTAGTDSNYGVWFFTPSENNTVENNTIRTRGNRTKNAGIVFQAVARNRAVGNRIDTNGTQENWGVYLTNANYTILINNTIYSNGTGPFNFGVLGDGGNNYTTITDNFIHTGGTNDNDCINLQFNSHNASITLNELHCGGTTSQNAGIALNWAYDSNATSNKIFTDGGTTGAYGVFLNGSRNIIANNTINATGDSTLQLGIYIHGNGLPSASGLNLIEGNNISTQGTNQDYGIAIWGATDHSVRDNVIHNNRVTFTNASDSAGLYMTGASDNNISNLYLYNVASWVRTVTTNGPVNTNITNLTFAMQNTTITYHERFNITGAVFLNHSDMNLTYNYSRLNFTTVANTARLFNRSAIISFNLTPAVLTNPMVVVNETGRRGWTDCNAANCTEISWNPATGIFVFNVSYAARSFAAIESPATLACGDTLTTDQTMTEDLSGTGTCFTLGASDITLDCNGFTITFDTDGTGAEYGVFAEHFKGLKVINCTILDGNPEGAGNVGINFSDVNNSHLYANRIQVNGTGITAGIVLNLGWRNNLTNNTVMGSAAYGLKMFSNNDTNITSNTFYANATNGAAAIYFDTGLLNRIENNTGQAWSASSNGLTLISAQYNSIVRNNLTATRRATGGASPYSDIAISLSSGSDYNLIAHNALQTNATSDSNFGISLSSIYGVNITNNTIRTFGADTNPAIDVFEGGNHAIINNSLFPNGTSSGNIGIRVRTLSVSPSNVSQNNISYNYILTSGTSANYGIHLSVSALNNTVMHNRIFTNGSAGFNSGIVLDEGSGFNNITNNTILTNGTTGNDGITVGLSSDNNTFTNNQIRTQNHNSFGISISNSNNSLFINTVLNGTVSWISSGLNTFNNLTNTTFATTDGTIRFPEQISFNQSIVNYTYLNVTLNHSMVNVTNLTMFNRSAFIILNGLSLVDAAPYVDYADLGAYVSCPEDICTKIDYAGGIFRFNVSHWTSYAASEALANLTIVKTDNFDPVNASSELNYTITLTGLTGNATNITLSEIYPDGAIFVSSSPAPIGGTNSSTFFIPANLSVGQSFTMNLSIITPNVTNATVINNTVNVSWSSLISTRDNLTATQSTTVVSNFTNACRTLGATGTYRLIQNLVTDQVVCFNITADNVVLDCQGFNITGNRSSSSGAGEFGSHGVNSTRNGPVIKNCLITNFTDGIFFLRVRNGTIFNNTLLNNSDDGVDLGNTNFTLISHNNATDNFDNGLELSGILNNITNNSLVNSRGDTFSNGLSTFAISDSNRITNNTIFGNQDDGMLILAGHGTMLQDNRVFGNGNDGILIRASNNISSRGDRVWNNSVQGFELTDANFSFVTHLNSSDNTLENLRLNSSRFGNFSNVTVDDAYRSSVRLHSNSTNNTFVNLTILANRTALWISDNDSTYNNFTSLRFFNENGSVHYPQNTTATAPTNVSRFTFNISFNRAFSNVTNLTWLNQSAIITLNDLVFTDPRLVVDYTDSGTNTTCPEDTCTEQAYFGSTMLFNVSHWTSFAVEETSVAALTAPVNIFPGNGTNDTTRMPNFNWSNSTNTGVPVNYSLEISTNIDFSVAGIIYNRTNISSLINANSTNYTINFTLDTDKVYWWRVIAYDSTGFSAYSNATNFSVQSVLSLNLTRRIVNFTTQPLNYTNDTTDNIPDAFELVNNGNLPVNVSITSEPLFRSGPTFPANNYQFGVRLNTTGPETGSFNFSNSTQNHTPFTSASTRKDIANLNWTWWNNTAIVDVNITIGTDEPAGVRNTTVTFSVI